jgi:hypothetical protein
MDRVHHLSPEIAALPIASIDAFVEPLHDNKDRATAIPSKQASDRILNCGQHSLPLL